MIRLPGLYGVEGVFLGVAILMAFGVGGIRYSGLSTVSTKS